MESIPNNPHPETRKPPHNLASYRGISLLPIVSRIFEKLLTRFLPIIVKNRLIPNHQFGFQQRHSTIGHTKSTTDK
jgi:hypothetical protein